MGKTIAKPVGIWIRVSTEDQARGESPEHHEKRAKFYAESKDWQVKEVYHLEAVSGKSVMEHPETQRMLGHIKNGHITGLIFSKLARLARNTKELLDFADMFREYNADLISLQESIDTSSPAGRLFYTMVAAMAQWEREEIADRVAASVPIRAKLGKPLSGSAPFGYQWRDRKLVPNPAETPVSKLVYEYFLEHKRKKIVARLLNEAGYRTRRGSKFTGIAIERILSDPTAKGVHRANYTKRVDGKKWTMKPESEWILTKVEPIISEELWEQCNQIQAEQKKTRKAVGRISKHLFTGFAYCHCDTKMLVPSNAPKYICPKCRNKISIPDLEEIFHQQLKGFLFSPEEISKHLEQADTVITEKQQLLATLADETQKIKKEMNKTHQLYLADQLSKKGFGDIYKPMEERLEQIDDQTSKLQAEITYLKVQYDSRDEVLTEARDLYSRWPNLDRAEKRQIIENITEKVVVGDKEVTINLCYLPFSPEMMMTKARRLPAPFFASLRTAGRYSLRFLLRCRYGGQAERQAVLCGDVNRRPLFVQQIRYAIVKAGHKRLNLSGIGLVLPKESVNFSVRKILLQNNNRTPQ